MAFEKTRLRIAEGSDDRSEFESELCAAIACFDVRRLTRCGGVAADPSLKEIQHVSIENRTLTTIVTINLTDGHPRDCSGSCSQPRVTRKESLSIDIDLDSGRAEWQTIDGVVTSLD
ncbi:hypothetical protein AB1L42_12950 [Thalassoglobus sp. JC818]|uniref:hypothetical protein n=1 Tax=Thalassoglobus sp. JC818 TaxID=3232136 RepID=UPI00345AA7AF